MVWHCCLFAIPSSMIWFYFYHFLLHFVKKGWSLATLFRISAHSPPVAPSAAKFSNNDTLQPKSPDLDNEEKYTHMNIIVYL